MLISPVGEQSFQDRDQREKDPIQEMIRNPSLSCGGDHRGPTPTGSENLIFLIFLFKKQAQMNVD